MSVWGRSPGLLASTAVALVLAVQPSVADPTNPNVVGGDATITAPATGTTLVDQATQRTIIEWDTFDVGVSESVIFTQPSADAIALNRVTGGQGPSSIDGRIDANGRIIITNQDGIVFGDGAVIDVGALIATTADIENDAFMNGSLDFNLSGNPDSQVINRGSITARDGGLIALIAPHAENAGVLSARVGRVAVAGGDRFTVDFTASDFLTLAIDPDSPAGQYLAQNSGEIAAEGGHVLLTTQTASDALTGVVNNGGIVEATSVDTSGGRIRLVAGGGATVTHSGTAVAQGTTGGTIEITAERVELTSTSVTDASGEFGGGTILIGGDYLGGNAEAAALQPLAPAFQDFPIYSAGLNFAEAGAEIRADAYTIGDGGQIIMWSNDHTRAAANISARGGADGGDGGFVEVSGGFLDLQTTPDLTATNGAGGTLLLDPHNVTIVEGFLANEYVAVNDGGTTLFAPIENDSAIGVDWMLAVLENGVNLAISTASATGTADGDITIFADIERTSRFDSTLILQADRDINIEPGVDITSSDGEFGLSLLAARDIDADQMGDLELRGGLLRLATGDDIELVTDSEMPDRIEIGHLDDSPFAESGIHRVELQFDRDDVEFRYNDEELQIRSGGINIRDDDNDSLLTIGLAGPRRDLIFYNEAITAPESFEWRIPSETIRTRSTDEDDVNDGIAEVIGDPNTQFSFSPGTEPRGDSIGVIEVSFDDNTTVDADPFATTEGGLAFLQSLVDEGEELEVVIPDPDPTLDPVEPTPPNDDTGEQPAEETPPQEPAEAPEANDPAETPPTEETADAPEASPDVGTDSDQATEAEGSDQLPSSSGRATNSGFGALIASFDSGTVETDFDIRVISGTSQEVTPGSSGAQNGSFNREDVIGIEIELQGVETVDDFSLVDIASEEGIAQVGLTADVGALNRGGSGSAGWNTLEQRFVAELSTEYEVSAVELNGTASLSDPYGYLNAEASAEVDVLEIEAEGEVEFRSPTLQQPELVAEGEAEIGANLAEVETSGETYVSIPGTRLRIGVRGTGSAAVGLNAGVEGTAVFTRERIEIGVGGKAAAGLGAGVMGSFFVELGE